MRAAQRGRAQTAALALLAAGVLLRAITWALMTPQNRDFHLGVITRFVDTGRLPVSNETYQSYHPPLYYLLTAPIFAITHRPKVVQMFSLACAIATLVVCYRLIVRTPLFGKMRDRLLLFALVVVHPQVITYGLYISNDTLTILLGAAVALQFWRWLSERSTSRMRWLAVLCGLGLLTKATFVAIIPVVALAVGVVSWRLDRGAAPRRTVEFVGIAAVIGCYKFVENTVAFGTPFVTNFDGGYSFIAEQARGRALPWAYIGFDWHRLLVEPTGEDRRPYLELLYQTAWYEYLPMSNLVASREWPSFVAASIALVVAVIPSAAAAIGLCVGAVALPRRLAAFSPPSGRSAIELTQCVLIATVVAIVLLLVSQELRWHTWPVMHARLLLPALPGLLAAVRLGWNTIRPLSPAAVDWTMRASIGATTALLLAQHLIDLSRVPFGIAH